MPFIPTSFVDHLGSNIHPIECLSEVVHHGSDKKPRHFEHVFDRNAAAALRSAHWTRAAGPGDEEVVVSATHKGAGGGEVRALPDGPPDVGGLTPRQRKVLEVISASVERRGYPPSMREIGDA